MTDEKLAAILVTVKELSEKFPVDLRPQLWEAATAGILVTADRRITALEEENAKLQALIRNDEGTGWMDKTEKWKAHAQELQAWISGVLLDSSQPYRQVPKFMK